MKLSRNGERVVVDNGSPSNPNYLRHIAAYMFAKSFTDDKIVLDNGSGSGYGSHYLITNGARKLIGTDVSNDAVQYARSRYISENLEFKTCDARHLTFDDGTFDVVVSFQVIEHIREMDEYLDEIVRVLKDSGTALISTPNKRTYSPNTPAPENPFHVKEFYLDEFMELLNHYFGNVEIWGVNQNARVEEFEKAVKNSLSKRVANFVRKIHLSFVLKMFPKSLEVFLCNPRDKKIDISDFTVTKTNLESCLDFVAVCKKT